MVNRKPNTFCIVCKKPLYRRPCEIKTGYNFYCSRACLSSPERSIRKANCAECKKVYVKVKSYSHYCSRSCANKARTGMQYKTGDFSSFVGGRAILKTKLLEIKEEICEICKIGPIWNNMPLTLQIDHINGNNKDNRIENLRFLCPNCHSQTDTFGAKNIGKIKSV